MRMRNILAIILLLWAWQASAQARDQYRYFGEIYVRAARLATLAPLCGLRDADWARRLERGISATRRDVVPAGQIEGLASAAFARTVGTRLFQTYGNAACREADDAMRWRDADELASGDHASEPPLPSLPDAVPPLGWQAFIATMAVRCDARDQRWGRAALAGLQRDIAMQEALAEEARTRQAMARHIVQTAKSMANLVHGTPGMHPCPALRANAALARVDEVASHWQSLCGRRRPDTTCRLGEEPR